MEINFDLIPEAIISLAANGDTSHAVRQLRAFASLRSPILIVGPVGIGKDTLARTIHEWSGQPGELIVRNCAAVQQDEILFCLDTASTLVLKNVGLLPPAVCQELVGRLITDGPSLVRIVAISTAPLERDHSLLETLPRELVSYLSAIQLTFDCDRPKDLLLDISRFLEDANRRYEKRVKVQEVRCLIFAPLAIVKIWRAYSSLSSAPSRLPRQTC